MASTHYLYSDAYYIAHHIIRKHSHLDSDERNEHFAALIIQRRWRGYVVRKMIEHWNHSAIIIQKNVRGWLLRWHLPDLYCKFLQWRTLRYYERMATRIQANWRGFYVRKYVMCVKGVLENRKRIAAENEKMQNLLREKFDAMKREQDEANERNAKQWVMFILYKVHHLLRTFCIEGVYSLHNKKKLSLIEKLLKAVSYTPYMSEVKKEYIKLYEEYKKPKPYVFKSSRLHRMEELLRLRRREANEMGMFDDSTHKNPFKLVPLVKRSAYERGLFAADKYTSFKNSFQKKTDKSKFMSKHDFNMYSVKNCDLDPKDIPYFTDLWEEFCSIHNISENMICLGNFLKFH